MFKIAGGKKEKETPFTKWSSLIPQAKAAANPEAPAPEPKPSVLTTGKQTGFAGKVTWLLIKETYGHLRIQKTFVPGAAKRAALKAMKLKEQQQSSQRDDGNATDLYQVSLP